MCIKSLSWSEIEAADHRAAEASAKAHAALQEVDSLTAAAVPTAEALSSQQPGATRPGADVPTAAASSTCHVTSSGPAAEARPPGTSPAGASNSSFAERLARARAARLGGVRSLPARREEAQAAEGGEEGEATPSGPSLSARLESRLATRLARFDKHNPSSMSRMGKRLTRARVALMTDEEAAEAAERARAAQAKHGEKSDEDNSFV